jgi:hypothetical protein
LKPISQLRKFIRSVYFSFPSSNRPLSHSKGVDFWHFVRLCPSRRTLGPTQPHIQWLAGAISPGVKRPGREADHSSPSSAEVKNGGAIPPLPPMSSWHSAKLIKHRENFTFT